MNDNTIINKRSERKQKNTCIFPYPFQVHMILHYDHKILNYKISLNRFLNMKIKSTFSVFSKTEIRIT